MQQNLTPQQMSTEKWLVFVQSMDKYGSNVNVKVHLCGKLIRKIEQLCSNENKH